MRWFTALIILVQYLVLSREVSLYVSAASTTDYDEDHWLQMQQLMNDSEYGVTWVYMPDGYGIPRVALLTEPPTNSRLRLNNGNVTFYLYTQSGHREGKEMENLQAASDGFQEYSSKKKTVILVHGWMAAEGIGGILKIRESFMSQQDVNLITVDWEQLAANFYYFDSARRTDYVGKSIAEFIDFMVTEMDLSLDDVHIIGHSLGAHTAGFAGKYVTTGKVGRITGLDPAGPYFYLKGPEWRLDPTDAQFVDVIHTAVGSAGHYKELGHVDFFPNGGIFQPGCGETIILKESCSHSKSQDYYAESVIDNNFFGYKCRSFQALQGGTCDLEDSVMMGEFLNTDAEGKYYVEVNKAAPFATGPKHSNCDA